jgi:hypothetical protein
MLRLADYADLRLERSSAPPSRVVSQARHLVSVVGLSAGRREDVMGSSWVETPQPPAALRAGIVDADSGHELPARGRAGSQLRLSCLALLNREIVLRHLADIGVDPSCHSLLFLEILLEQGTGLILACGTAKGQQ